MKKRYKTNRYILSQVQTVKTYYPFEFLMMQIDLHSFKLAVIDYIFVCPSNSNYLYKF